MLLQKFVDADGVLVQRLMQSKCIDREDPIISFLRGERMLDDRTFEAVVDRHNRAGQSLIGILKTENLIEEEQFARAVAAANDIDFVALALDMIDPMAAHLLSYETANKHNVIPVRKKDDQLWVAMSWPLNLTVRDQIEMSTGYKVIPLAATTSALEQAIRHHFSVANVTKQAIVAMRLKDDRDSGPCWRSMV